VNVIKELKREFGITAVSRKSGDLELYYSGDPALRQRIIVFLSMKNWLSCFVNLHFITV